MLPNRLSLFVGGGAYALCALLANFTAAAPSARCRPLAVRLYALVIRGLLDDVEEAAGGGGLGGVEDHEAPPLARLDGVALLAEKINGRDGVAPAAAAAASRNSRSMGIAKRRGCVRRAERAEAAGCRVMVQEAARAATWCQT